MKKLLLSLVAFVATMGAFAQDAPTMFNKTFTPVTNADDLGGMSVASAPDGSVYASSTYTQAFQFAGKALTDSQEMVSACILKYDVQGNEQWSVTFVGSAIIYSMQVDADGTLYAAGSFMDEVEYTGADGVKATIKSADVYSAFIAKISADGKFLAVKIITPETDAEIAAAVGDPWGDGFDMPLYSAWDPIYITPRKLQIDGDKLYVSATYMGDVAEIGWEGSYVDTGIYSDNRSAGVFSLNKSDLSGAKSVANVQMTGIVGIYEQYYPEAISFVAENGTVFVGFIGFGNLTLTTADKTEDYAFEYGKHPFVLATIAGSTTTKTFDAAPHDKVAKPYNLFMETKGGNLILGGTFYGELPFGEKMTSGDVSRDEEGNVTYSLSHASFVASLTKSGNVNWSFVSPRESQAVMMTVDIFIYLNADDGQYSFEFDGYFNPEEDYTTAVKNATADTYGSSIASFIFPDADGVTLHVAGISGMVEEEEIDPNLVEIPQSQGREYDDFARAELVLGDDYNTYTVNDDLTIAIKMMNVDVEGCDYVVIKFAEPVAAGWMLAFWGGQDLVGIPEGATEYQYVFADDPNCAVADGVLPQICMMTFFGGYEKPLVAKVSGIYKHKIGDSDAIADIKTVDKKVDGKYFENGRIVIRKGGVKYNVAGQPIK